MKKGKDFMDDLITIAEAAEKLKVAESTLRTWKRRKEIPEECFKTIGTRVYIRKEKFKSFIDS